jgi:uncharacterized protein YjbI with pentapeptide repeats
MSERQQSPYDSIARSWLALVERRQRNFVELCTTGRWRHYYTQAQLLDEVRKVLHLRAEWARLAGVPVSEQIDLQQIDLQQIDLQQIDLQQIDLQQIDLQQIDLQQNIKQSDRYKQDAGGRGAKLSSHAALGQRRLPASAILAAVAGRL